MTLHAACLLFTVVLVSCIEDCEIDPALIADAERPLYIEGHIISGGNSTFYVTQATEIGGSKIPVKGAEIIIESDAGFRSDAAMQCAAGEYIITTGVLNDTHRYRVAVHVSDETYTKRNANMMTLDQWIGNCLGAMSNGHVVATNSLWPVGAADPIYLLSPSCYSCFARGGTKDKPSWWPNNHE